QDPFVAKLLTEFDERSGIPQTSHATRHTSPAQEQKSESVLATAASAALISENKVTGSLGRLPESAFAGVLTQGPVTFNKTSATRVAAASAVTYRSGRLFGIGKPQQPRVIMVTPEIAPFSKKGGLADFMGVGSMPHALARLGMDIHIVTYLYDDIDIALHDIEDTGKTVSVALGDERETLKVYRKVAVVEGKAVTIYFLRHPIYSHKPYLEYIDKVRTREDYEKLIERLQDSEDSNKLIVTKDVFDMMHRLAFKQAVALSKGTLELGKMLNLAPTVVHAHDWQAGLVPFLMVKHPDYQAYYKKALKIYTIHNAAYQGVFGKEVFPYLNLNAKEFRTETLEFKGDVSTLKAGLTSSDKTNTVSKTYAKEIATPAFGQGLEGLFAKLSQRGRLFGILNGVNYRDWNPQTDELLPQAARYTPGDLSGKANAKKILQHEFALPERNDVFLFGAVARLTAQKGFDRLVQVIPSLIDAHKNIQFVLLGTGEPEIEESLIKLKKEYPEQIGLRIGFSNRLAHHIEAGSDAFTMFSQFEPCGLNQMYSLKYGTLPIVFATGGLVDTVADSATGFVFNEHTPAHAAEAMERAVNIYFNQPDKWQEMIANAMSQDYSWEHSAREYVETMYGFVTETKLVEAASRSQINKFVARIKRLLSSIRRLFIRSSIDAGEKKLILHELRNNFELSTQSVQSMVNAFISDMHKGLAGQPSASGKDGVGRQPSASGKDGLGGQESSLAMLPTFVDN
ncbi:MAG: glycogen/starch synthase, partial [Candidatus Omnitrophota bacterium]